MTRFKAHEGDGTLARAQALHALLIQQHNVECEVRSEPNGLPHVAIFLTDDPDGPCLLVSTEGRRAVGSPKVWGDEWFCQIVSPHGRHEVLLDASVSMVQREWLGDGIEQIADILRAYVGVLVLGIEEWSKWGWGSRL